MSNLQNKSGINLTSARLLYDKAFFPPVAHCSYYACYQMFKHLWLYKMNKTQAELDVLNHQKREGSHEVLINEILKFIKNSEKINRHDDFRALNTDILLLKKLRTKADYDDSDFDSSNSAKAISLSDEIMPLLKKYQ